MDRLGVDLAAMLPLPPIPLHLGWRNRIRLGRDYDVRLDTNDYSVDPSVIGRLVDVTADLERVKVRVNGRIVADHSRVWAHGTTVTDPVHVEIAAGGANSSNNPGSLEETSLLTTSVATLPTTTEPSALSTVEPERGRSNGCRHQDRCEDELR